VPGRRIIGGLGQVVLDDLRPTLGFGYNGLGREDGDGFAGNWFAEVSSLCAKPLPGLHVVSKSSVSDSTSLNKLATAACPAGESLVGSGGEITSGAFGNVTFNEVRPGLGVSDDKTFVTATELPGGTSGNWSVTAHAVCAAKLPGLVLQAAVSDSDSFASKAVSVSCPAGKQVISTGGQIVNGHGEVVLKDIHASATLRSVTAAAEEGQSGSLRNWRIRAFALCA
jgi:hypothetical protein